MKQIAYAARDKLATICSLFELKIKGFTILILPYQHHNCKFGAYKWMLFVEIHHPWMTKDQNVA